MRGTKVVIATAVILASSAAGMDLLAAGQTTTAIFLFLIPAFIAVSIAGTIRPLWEQPRRIRL